MLLLFRIGQSVHRTGEEIAPGSYAVAGKAAGEIGEDIAVIAVAVDVEQFLVLTGVLARVMVDLDLCVLVVAVATVIGVVARQRMRP